MPEAEIKKLEQLHAIAKGKLREHAITAIEAGKILERVKVHLGHGPFGKWIKDNLSFTHRTANNYMNAFRNRAKLETDSNLTVTGLAKRCADPTRKGREKKNAGTAPKGKVPFTLDSDEEDASFRDTVRQYMEIHPVADVKAAVFKSLKDGIAAGGDR